MVLFQPVPEPEPPITPKAPGLVRALAPIQIPEITLINLITRFHPPFASSFFDGHFSNIRPTPPQIDVSDHVPVPRFRPPLPQLDLN